MKTNSNVLLPLRPLSMIEVLDGSFAVLREIWGASVLVVLALVVPIELLSAAVSREPAIFSWWGLVTSVDTTGRAGQESATLLALIALLIVAPILTGACVQFTLSSLRGNQASFADITTLMRRLHWVFLAEFIGLVAQYGIVVLGALVVITGSAGGGITLFTLGFPIAMVLAPFTSLFVPAVLTAKDGQMFASVQHTVRLAFRGYARVLSVLLVTMGITSLLTGVVKMTPLVWYMFRADDVVPEDWDWMILTVLSSVAVGFTVPFRSVIVTLLHTDLRVRKEGLDVVRRIEQIEVST